MMPKTSDDQIRHRIDNEGQLDRFKQTARELGCDETGEAFERAFAKAVPPKKPEQPKKPADRSE